MKSRKWLVRPIALAVGSCFGASSWANPTGPQVINGIVSMQRPDARTLNVTNSPGSIIHWQGFSIGAGEATRFVQQSAASAVLNRVVGASISQIHGQLSSNGRVFLINPAGILIGPGGIIDTAGFVGSTLNMKDADFLAGKLKFQGDAKSGSIVNQGWIKTGQGGNVVLVAPNIENSGLIETPGGELILAAGQKVTIGSLDLEGVEFELQAPTDSVVNLGKLIADGGAVGVFAGTLKHSGDIRANALARDEGGRIVLKAQSDLTIEAGSTTSASGGTGGSITVQAGGTTLVSGKLEAIGSERQGGLIRMLGRLVGFLTGARADASGETGGGTVLVGGDYQGKNPSVQNAWRTFVGRDATVRADAITSGDGGKVIVWADDITRYYGSTSARGGAQSGNGGFIEVSGKRYLDFRGTVDTRAPRGAVGTLLLDPTDINIVADPGTSDPDTDFLLGTFEETAVNDATLDPTSEITVTRLRMALQTGNVTINTNDTTATTVSGAGDINFDSEFDFNGIIGTKTLTLIANGNINIKNPIRDSMAGGETLNIALDSGVATVITADIALGGGLLDAAATAGTNVVKMPSGTLTLSNMSSFNVGRLDLSGADATFNSPVDAGFIDISAGIAKFNANSTAVNARLFSGTLGGTGVLTVDQSITLGGAGGDGVLAGTVVSGSTGIVDGTPQITGMLTTGGNGGLSMTGGTLTIAPGGVLNLTDAFADTVNNAVINNQGTLNLMLGPGTNLELDSGALFFNSGTFDFRTDSGIRGGGGPSFSNTGLVQKSGGTGASVIGINNMVDFTNASGATIHVQSGTLQTANNSFPVNDGTIIVDTGTTFATTGNLTNSSTGVIRGTGTLDMFATGSTLLNNGLVAPGASPGTLTIGGNYTQGPGGVLDIELGGTTQGVTYDLLQVNGDATLNGTLRVRFLTPFTGAQGNTYDVMNYNSRTGDFSTFDFQGAALQPNPMPLFYQLTQLTQSSQSSDSSFGRDSGNTILREQDRMRESLPDDDVKKPDDGPPSGTLECR